MIISNHIEMRCTLCGKEHKIKRRLFCYHAADRHDPAGRWCGGGVPVAQGLQTNGVLDSRGCVKFDGNVLGGACV